MSNSEIEGIDVSHWQGEITFDDVKTAGKDFVFIKSSEGGSVEDKEFAIYYNNAKMAGLQPHVWHFFIPSTRAELQRNLIVKLLKKAGFDGTSARLAVSVADKQDVSNEDRAKHLHELLQLLDEKDGILQNNKPFIYTTPDFWEKNVWENSDTFNQYNFQDYPLWILQEGVENPTIPAPWSTASKTWTVWTYNEGPVKGIPQSNTVHLNKMVTN